MKYFLMKDVKNLNIKLNINNSLPNLKNLINKGTMDSSIENMFKEKGLENNTILSNKNKKVTKITQLIIKLSENIIYTNKSLLNFLNKNEYNLNILYIICKSAFLNMSSIISKPIVSINSNVIKITLFYY